MCPSTRVTDKFKFTASNSSSAWSKSTRDACRDVQQARSTWSSDTRVRLAAVGYLNTATMYLLVRDHVALRLEQHPERNEETIEAGWRLSL